MHPIYRSTGQQSFGSFRSKPTKASKEHAFRHMLFEAFCKFKSLAERAGFEPAVGY